MSATQKFFGYFPTLFQHVQRVDITHPSGSPRVDDALLPSEAIDWNYAGPIATGVQLRAAEVHRPG
jgi:hypothetical protein